jgi:hypothetical protein
LSLLLSGFSSLVVGLVLVVAPWTALWETNYLLQPSPVLRAVLLAAFTRGLVSGLGLLNLLLAMEDAYALLLHAARRPGEPRP